jgi:hypothetical protein
MTKPTISKVEQKELVRILLGWYGRGLQGRGKIPSDVSGFEIETAMEHFVAPVVELVRQSDEYDSVEPKNLEWLICRVMKEHIFAKKGTIWIDPFDPPLTTDR